MKRSDARVYRRVLLGMVLVACVLAVAALALVTRGGTIARGARDGSLLSFEHGLLDLGALLPGTVHKRCLSLRNNTRVSLAPSDIAFRSSCASCVRAWFASSGRLSSGGEGEVVVEFKAGYTPGPQRADVFASVPSVAGDPVARLTIKGAVTGALLRRPRRVYFGRAVVGRVHHHRVNLQGLTGDIVGWQITEVHTSKPWLSVRVIQLSPRFSDISV